MRTYEALYIVNPNLEDDQIQTVAREVETLVTGDGGAIVRSEVWGRRKLAYEVQKFSEGCYVLLRFTARPAFIARIENHFRLTEVIIRYLVVHFDEKMLQLEAEQQRRKEEEIRASGELARRRAERASERGDDDDDDDEGPPGGGPRRGRAYDDDDDDMDDDR